jgi:hypothetical protein
MRIKNAPYFSSVIQKSMAILFKTTVMGSSSEDSLYFENEMRMVFKNLAP